MTWSFVIVTYDSERHIGTCLAALSMVHGSEVIMVDNASTDSTREIARRSGVRLLENKINIGFAAACNQGAALAEGAYLCFINPDTFAGASVWPALAAVFERHPDIGILSPRIIDQEERMERFSRGHFPTLTRLITRSIGYSQLEAADVSYVDWVSGAVLAIRCSLFHELKGFDESFFMYFEDIDLCRRAAPRYRTAIVSSVSVRHERGQSLSDDRLRKRYYYRSQLRYFRKHFGKVRALLLRLVRLPAVIVSV